MVDFEIQQLNMMSVPESRTAVERADGINGRDSHQAVPTPERTMSPVRQKNIALVGKAAIRERKTAESGLSPLRLRPIVFPSNAT